MKIQIEQNEIEAAVREYVANQGIKVEGKVLSLEFRMTRVDGGGLLANLSIDDPVPTTITKAVTKQPRAGTVGAAIEKQADKAPAANVNKLPTSTASESDTATESKSNEVGSVGDAATENGEVVPADDSAVAESKPATTTSLFG